MRSNRKVTPPALQVGALPWRQADDGPVGILLVTARGSGRWIIPKGWPMRGRSLAEASAQEAYEEAGIRGIVGAELGRYRYEKDRSLLRPLLCEVAVHSLKVEEEYAAWPENRQRRRKGFELRAAANAVRATDLARLIRNFRARL